MAQYTSVLLRQNLSDQGDIPRTGGWTATPDLIAAGTAPITDPQGTYGAAASYATDPTQPVVENAPNYFYLRGKNLGSNATTADARAYFAPQSLFLYPVQWLQNEMQTSRGATVSPIASIEPNAIGVTTDPFCWVPPTTDQHYCLIGIISTPAVPFSTQQPPAAVSSLNDLATWIGQTGGAGWHNVQWSSSSATFTNSTVYPASSTAAKVQLSLTCIGLPVGSQVSFSCGTPLPDGTVVNLPPTTVSTSGKIGFFLPIDVPANWTSPISYTYYANGGTPLPTFSLSMSASIVQQSADDSFAAYTRPAHEVFPNHHMVDLESGALVGVGDMPVNYVIPVGSDVTFLTGVSS